MPSGRVVSYAIQIEYIAPRIIDFMEDLRAAKLEAEGANQPEYSGFRVTVGDRYTSGLTLGEMLEVVIAVTNGQRPMYLHTEHEHYLRAAWHNCCRYLYPGPFDLVL